jgi:hypothetical protein
MAIRSRVVVNKNVVQEVNRAVRGVKRQVDKAAQASYRKVFPGLERRLARYPSQRPAGVKHEFASDKSRRWYFAAVNGRIPGVTIPTSNGRYARTGQLGDSWKATLRVQDNRTDFIVSSDYDSTWRGQSYPIAALVGGPIAPNSKFNQVPGHRRVWGRNRYRRIVVSGQQEYERDLKKRLRSIDLTDAIIRRNL